MTGGVGLLLLAMGLAGGWWLGAGRRRPRIAALLAERDSLASRLAETQKQQVESAALAESLTVERTALRTLLDALPLPVWRRDAELGLVDANRAYATAVDADPAIAVAEKRELAGAEGRLLAARARETGAAQQ